MGDSIAFPGMTAFHAVPSIPSELIGGVNIATISRRQTARLMIDMALARRNKSLPPIVCSSANGQVLSEMGKASNSAHASALMEVAHVVSADGQSLVFASKLLGTGRLRERCATTDLFHDVAEIAVAENVSFYMLGASEEENRKATDNMQRRYPQLRIVGRRNGYFSTIEDEKSVVQGISDLKPDIVWVALGYPRELEFCERWRNALSGVGVLKTSGGLFNFLSGARRRAPMWMQMSGLEWAFRAYLEPRRLFARYAVTNVHATWLLLRKTGIQRRAE